MFALVALAVVVASAQAGLVGHGVGLGYGAGLGYGGLGYGAGLGYGGLGYGAGLGYGGLGYGHGIVAAPAIAKVATPIVASSAVTTRADHYAPIIGKALAPVGVAKVGYAAAPIAAYGGHGLGLGGLGYGAGLGYGKLW